jgi:prepilin-type N-terminal cleavage/methylation domain-containing protein
MRRAFTLIELLIVMTVILILVGMLSAGAMLTIKAATKRQCQALLVKVATAIEAYQQDRKVWPVIVSGYAAGTWTWVNTANTTLQTELVATTPDHRGNARRGYLVGELNRDDLANGMIVDPYGQPLIFYGPPWPGPQAYPGNANSFELWSAGPDGRFNDLRSATGLDKDNIPARPYDPSWQK